ncbi:hypothetical protein HAX54_049996 [Datura stramonium]|uniref:Uncharacterized protein n=1 Tax=Datura stramonium TaxID=4076 RepID=A0ABS8SVT4_DATST|nr:hypothetical protein [Datura stramonium]
MRSLKVSWAERSFLVKSLTSARRDSISSAWCALSHKFSFLLGKSIPVSAAFSSRRAETTPGSSTGCWPPRQSGEIICPLPGGGISPLGARLSGDEEEDTSAGAVTCPQKPTGVGFFFLLSLF